MWGGGGGDKRARGAPDTTARPASLAALVHGSLASFSPSVRGDRDEVRVYLITGETYSLSRSTVLVHGGIAPLYLSG